MIIITDYYFTLGLYLCSSANTTHKKSPYSCTNEFFLNHWYDIKSSHYWVKMFADYDLSIRKYFFVIMLHLNRTICTGCQQEKENRDMDTHTHTHSYTHLTKVLDTSFLGNKGWVVLFKRTVRSRMCLHILYDGKSKSTSLDEYKSLTVRNIRIPE